ncbi:hypothetical protein L0F63_001285 [Massospora cicadina]|nr:hypothetical protein L0F63_001285 [Massospora cicadina]
MKYYGASTALNSEPAQFEKDPDTGKEIKLVGWEELAQHNSAASCWIAVRGKVYDVTFFLERHPGALIPSFTGQGETPLYLASVLSKFLIGRLVSDELPTFPEPNAFHRALKDLLATWGLINYHPWVKKYVLVQSLLALVLGFGCAQVGLHPLHDASHFAITHHPLVWKLVGQTHDFLNGASYLVWVYQHMMGHHPYTNIPGADPDIATTDPDVRRIQPFQKWYGRYVGQEKYVPFLYGLLALKTRFQDIFILYFFRTNDSIRINPPTLYHRLVFWGGKAFFVFYRLVIPIHLVGFWKSVLFLILSDLVTSYWLALTFQVNHVVDTVAFIASPERAESKQIAIDWAEMQLLTTQDYAHHSTFWTWITGGLNYQAVHHVFPQDSFLKALNGHIAHLRDLGSKSEI